MIAGRLSCREVAVREKKTNSVAWLPRQESRWHAQWRRPQRLHMGHHFVRFESISELQLDIISTLHIIVGFQSFAEKFFYSLLNDYVWLTYTASLA